MNLGGCQKVFHWDGGHSKKALWNHVKETTFQSDGPYSAWIGLGLKHGDLLVLIQGITYPIEPERLGARGVRGLIICDELKTDLSHSQLVDGPELEEFLAKFSRALRAN